MIKIRGQRGLRWRLLPLVRLAFQFGGKGWNGFYAWMLNRIERGNTLDHVLKEAAKRAKGDAKEGERGLYDLRFAQNHLDLLIEQGLKPQCKLFDFGCGYGRSAVPLLKYLEPGNYIGVDLSAERIRIAKEYVAHEGLSDRAPTFIASLDNSMAYLPDASIDFAFSKAVMVHVPVHEIAIILKSMRRVMKPGGVYIFDHEVDGDSTDAVTVKDFWHPPHIMDAMAAAAGFETVEIKNPLPDQVGRKKFDPDLSSYARMVRLTAK